MLACSPEELIDVWSKTYLLTTGQPHGYALTYNTSQSPIVVPISTDLANYNYLNSPGGIQFSQGQHLSQSPAKLIIELGPKCISSGALKNLHSSESPKPAN